MYCSVLPREGASQKGDNVMDSKLFNSTNFLGGDDETSIEDQEENVELDNAIFNDSNANDESNR
jgi:hypothetical protein